MRHCPNDLRRSFATACANTGVPEFRATRWMGHTSSTMVRRVYAQAAETRGDELDPVERWKAEQHRLAEAKRRDDQKSG